MISQDERIAQFQKMANDDPDNELGHFSLAKALLDAGRHAEAVASFERTLALNPQFSKAYQLLGQSLLQSGQRDKAIQIYREGFAVADERGDNMPRDEMATALKGLGVEPPQTKRTTVPTTGGGGFPCQRPGCHAGAHAHQLKAPP